MNIRKIQANLAKLNEDNLIKFLYDIVMHDISNVNLFVLGETYYKGDRVYILENGVHKVYECMLPETDNFSTEDWEHILDVYTEEIKTVNNFKVIEEVHIITEATRNSITSNLEFKQENCTFIAYKGKKRYAANYDFTVNDKTLTFNKPFNVGDRVILEIRESIGLPDRLVLLSSNGFKYEVGVIGEDVYIFESDHNTSKNEVYVKDIVNGKNYKIYMIDEDLYYEVTDINVSNTEVKIMDEAGKEYKVEMIDDEIFYSIKE